MSVVLCGFTIIKHDILYREAMNEAMGVHHVTCPTTSLARFALTDPKTVQQLVVKQLKSITFQYVQIIINFLYCRDTFYVDSFNYHLLCYIPKRIHFSTRVSIMRMNLAGCS